MCGFGVCPSTAVLCVKFFQTGLCALSKCVGATEGHISAAVRCVEKGSGELGCFSLSPSLPVAEKLILRRVDLLQPSQVMLI